MGVCEKQVVRRGSTPARILVTTAAVDGQLAGTFYDEEDIPERWRSKLAHLEVLESFAARLMSAAS